MHDRISDIGRNKAEKIPRKREEQTARLIRDLPMGTLVGGVTENSDPCWFHKDHNASLRSHGVGRIGQERMRTREAGSRKRVPKRGEVPRSKLWYQSTTTERPVTSSM